MARHTVKNQAGLEELLRKAMRGDAAELGLAQGKDGDFTVKDIEVFFKNIQRMAGESEKQDNFKLGWSPAIVRDVLRFPPASSLSAVFHSTLLGSSSTTCAST